MTEPAANRDYAAEVRALVDAETAEGPYVPRVVADHLVTKLRATDPDLLDGWLHLNASHLFWDLIDRRDRSRRSHARRTAARGEFRSALVDRTAGDVDPLRRFLDMPLTVGSGHRKRLADLTAVELRHVADTYIARADDNLLMAAFLRVLAKKVKRGTVADHYTDDQLARVWHAQAESRGADT